MKLSTMHQILIIGAMGLAALFALRSLYLWLGLGDGRQSLLALVGIALAVAAGLYLRHFRRKLSRRA